MKSARFAGPDATYADNVEKLLAELAGVDDRVARFRTVVALVSPDGKELVAEGALEGRIAREGRGSFGFGYDQVFEVASMEFRTLGEIPEAEKNQISHRANALAALAERL